MDNVFCLLAGITIGAYILNSEFRGRFNKGFLSFVAWLKDVVERNKKIRKLQEENKSLKYTVDTVSFKQKIG